MRVVLVSELCERTSRYATLAQRLQLEAFLRSRASAEAPGVPLTVLRMAPFTRADGEDYVQLDAAVVAGHTVYVGE